MWDANVSVKLTVKDAIATREWGPLNFAFVEHSTAIKT